MQFRKVCSWLLAMVMIITCCPIVTQGAMSETDKTMMLRHSGNSKRSIMEQQQYPYEERVALVAEISAINSKCLNESLDYGTYQNLYQSQIYPKVVALNKKYPPNSGGSGGGGTSGGKDDASDSMEDALGGGVSDNVVITDTGEIDFGGYWKALENGYVRFGLGAHYTYQTAGGDWIDGSPGSMASNGASGYKVNILDITDLPKDVKERVKNVECIPYNYVLGEEDWTHERFIKYPTQLMIEGKTEYGGWNAGFIEKYNKYITMSQRDGAEVGASIDYSNYDAKTGEIHYREFYPLSTAGMGGEGYDMHTMLRNDYKDAIASGYSKQKATDYAVDLAIERYEYVAGSLEADNLAYVTKSFETLLKSDKTKGYMYFVPKLYVFELETGDMGMVEPLQLIDATGKATETPMPGQQMSANFTVKNLGLEKVGLDATKNPKATIDVSVVDNLGNKVYTDTLTSTEVLDPDKTVTIKTPQFTNNALELTVCGTINKVHTEKGYNKKNENDTLCKTFKHEMDMGVAPRIELKEGGTPVENFEPGKNYNATVYVNHIEGMIDIGLDASKNPKATVDITVENSKGEVVKKIDNQQATAILKPGSSVPIQIPNVSSPDSALTICAKIDSEHTRLGYNKANENDKYCETFGSVANLAIA